VTAAGSVTQPKFCVTGPCSRTHVVCLTQVTPHTSIFTRSHRPWSIEDRIVIISALYSCYSSISLIWAARSFILSAPFRSLFCLLRGHRQHQLPQNHKTARYQDHNALCGYHICIADSGLNGESGGYSPCCQLLYFRIVPRIFCGLHLRNSLYASRTSGSSGCERTQRQEIARNAHALRCERVSTTPWQLDENTLVGIACALQYRWGLFTRSRTGQRIVRGSGNYKGHLGLHS
jgi:hypothetical protein